MGDLLSEERAINQAIAVYNATVEQQWEEQFAPLIKAKPEGGEEKDLQDFVCGICLCYFSAPTLLPCEHTFCAGCVKALMLGPRSDVCPLCRVPFTAQVLSINCRIFNEMLGARVNCNESCGSSFTPLMAQSHSNECPEALTCCPHHKLGCEWQHKRGMLKDHLESSCPYEEIKGLGAAVGSAFTAAQERMRSYEAALTFQARRYQARSMEVHSQVQSEASRAAVLGQSSPFDCVWEGILLFGSSGHWRQLRKSKAPTTLLWLAPLVMLLVKHNRGLRSLRQAMEPDQGELQSIEWLIPFNVCVACLIVLLGISENVYPRSAPIDTIGYWRASLTYWVTLVITAWVVFIAEPLPIFCLFNAWMIPMGLEGQREKEQALSLKKPLLEGLSWGILASYFSPIHCLGAALYWKLLRGTMVLLAPGLVMKILRENEKKLQEGSIGMEVQKLQLDWPEQDSSPLRTIAGVLTLTVFVCLGACGGRPLNRLSSMRLFLLVNLTVLDHLVVSFVKAPAGSVPAYLNCALLTAAVGAYTIMLM
ncbi:unnamed protein product [Chrysoparadoxa australica]